MKLAKNTVETQSDVDPFLMKLTNSSQNQLTQLIVVG